MRADRGALGERYRLAPALGAGCGLRQGEAFGLPVDDIDEGAQVVHVVLQLKRMRGQFVFAPPEHGAFAMSHVPDTVKAALRTHLTRYPPLTMTFPWREPNGEPITVRVLTWTRERGALNRNSFNHHVWKPALRKAGVVDPKRGDGFHALRHFYASVLLDGGESIKALSEYLGHADPGFTLRTYTHLMPSSAERTRRAVDAVLTSGHDEGPASQSEDRNTGPSQSDGLLTA
ncbi:tyrosine-type recombinase/integrase [Pseudonocardia kunmingensis]|uniref:Phage integrase family protein n=1 Tax=Pseudonocardia kunmingensis TaxID=630975 RepID=A0A543DNM5_9PSEU|nr:tyrosine-type recombinase/integrase [Pseudonocardia kunmingensis]TQM10922.1 phage integrase family protein [Pseudonocardia kunmingensis]